METLHRQTKTYLFLPFKERESGDINATVKTALLKEMGLRGWCLTERERGREKHLLVLLHGEFMSIYEKLITLCCYDFIPNLFYLLMLFFSFCSFLTVCNIMKKRMTLNPVFFFVDFMYIIFVFWNCLKLFSVLFWFFGFMRPTYKMVDISYKLISICSLVLLCYVILSFETLIEALFCILFLIVDFIK